MSYQPPQPRIERPEEPSNMRQWREDQRKEWYASVDRQHEADVRARASYDMSIRGEQRAIEAEARQIANMAEHRGYQERAEARAIEHHQEQQEYQRRSEQRALEAHQMHQQSHALQMERERERQEREREARRLARERFNNPNPSGALGDARWATIDDCRDMGLCDSSGLLLGVMRDEANRRLAGLFHNGERHITTYANTSGGKGVNLILPNLALYGRHRSKPRSLVVVDVKNGENAYATAYHRMQDLGQRAVFINPSGLYGLPGTAMNPFSSVIYTSDGNKFARARGVASVFAPVLNPHSDNAWVNLGAALLLSAVIAHLAATRPKECNPGNLWEIFHSGKGGLQKLFAEFTQSPLPSVRGLAREFADWMKADRQWAAYSSSITEALSCFTPESPYTQATKHDEYDARRITQEATTVYVMMKYDDLADNGRWVALILNHLIRVTAANGGPCGALFIMDEFTQLPPIPRILEAVNMHGSSGQRFWFFAQDRKSLERHYGEHGRQQIEGQSDIVQTWNTLDRGLLQDWEYLAGKTSVQVVGASMSEGGQIGTGLTLTEQTRPLFQPEVMRQAPRGTQFLLCRTGPIVKAGLMPWYEIPGVQSVVHSTKDLSPRAVLPKFQHAMMNGDPTMPAGDPTSAAGYDVMGS